MRKFTSGVRAPLPFERKKEQKIIGGTCPRCGTILPTYKQVVLRCMGIVKCGKCGKTMVKISIIH